MNVNNTIPIKIFNVKDVEGDVDQSYDHLVKGDNKRVEEIKQHDFNEELKEGFIGDLCRSSRRLSKEKQIDDSSFDIQPMQDDRSRCKTALVNPGMRSTGGESKMQTKLTPITPMVNNILDENNEGNQSIIEQELQALVSENEEAGGRNSPELEAQIQP